MTEFPMVCFVRLWLKSVWSFEEISETLSFIRFIQQGALSSSWWFSHCLVKEPFFHSALCKLGQWSEANYSQINIPRKWQTRKGRKNTGRLIIVFLKTHLIAFLWFSSPAISLRKDARWFFALGETAWTPSVHSLQAWTQRNQVLSSLTSQNVLGTRWKWQIASALLWNTLQHSKNLAQWALCLCELGCAIRLPENIW